MLGHIGAVLGGSFARTMIEKVGGTHEPKDITYAGLVKQAKDQVTKTQYQSEKGIKRYSGQASQNNVSMQRLLNEVYGPAYRAYPMIVQRIISQAQSEGHSSSVISSIKNTLASDVTTNKPTISLES